MSKFDLAFPYVLFNEGGYSESEKGCPSNFGITKEKAEDYGYTGDLRALPISFVKKIYRCEHWQFDEIESQAAATKLLDMCVAFGSAVGIFLAQEMLNKNHGAGLEMDGRFGPCTLEAINRQEPSVVLEGLASISESHCRILISQSPSQPCNRRGWLTRAARLPSQR